MTAAQARLSVSLALSALRDQCQALYDAEQTVVVERATRDDLIRDARAAGIRYGSLTKITGLGRDRLYSIVNAPDSADGPAPTPSPARPQASAHAVRSPHAPQPPPRAPGTPVPRQPPLPPLSETTTDTPDAEDER